VLAHLHRGPAGIPDETRRFIASQQGDAEAARTQTPGSIYINVTRDDRYLFVSDEWVQTISVIDLETARRMAFASAPVIGRIPTGVCPIAMTVRFASVFIDDDHIPQ